METEKNEIQVAGQASPLMDIISAASADGGVDADKLMKLLEAQEKWEANEARKAYHVAMAAFQSEAPKIIKDSKGHNSNYAGLPTVVSAVAPILSQNGLSHSWVTETEDKNINVTCKITHVQGHSESVSLSAGADTSGNKNSIQALGSTVTYLQRYTLKAVLGLAEQDDDGAGSDGGDFPRTSDAEQATIEKIGECMIDSLPDGVMLDTDKLGRFLFSLQGRYPDDIKKANEIAGKVIDRFNKNDTWEVVAKEA